MRRRRAGPRTVRPIETGRSKSAFAPDLDRIAPQGEDESRATPRGLSGRRGNGGTKSLEAVGSGRHGERLRNDDAAET